MRSSLLGRRHIWQYTHMLTVEMVNHAPTILAYDHSDHHCATASTTYRVHAYTERWTVATCRGLIMVVEFSS